MFKTFLNWLIGNDEKEQKSYDSEVPGKVIQCHDCGEYGYFATPWAIEFEYYIPSGWTMIWFAGEPLFLCEKCREKRRKFGMEILNSAKSNHGNQNRKRRLR